MADTHPSGDRPPAVTEAERRRREEYAALGFPEKRIFVAPNAVAPRPERTVKTRPLQFAGRPSLLLTSTPMP